MSSPPTPTGAEPPLAVAEPPLAERIASDLRDEILRGRYRSGDRLPSERELALRLGVHRGAAREALKRVEQLGLAEIGRGGARVRPIEQASLDVLEPLLELHDPPDPALVDQLLEVLFGHLALAARLGVPRADAPRRARATQILEELEERGVDEAGRQARLFELGRIFVEASGNLVLGLVARGLETSRITARLQQLSGLGAAGSEAPGRLPLEAIRRAVANADGCAASEAIHQLAAELRRDLARQLEETP